MRDTTTVAGIVLTLRQTLLTLALASLVLVPVATASARRTGCSWWRVAGAAGAALGTALVVAVTLGRWDEGSSLHWPRHCLLQPGLSWTTPEEQLNVLLFGPACFFAALALRRCLVAVALGVLGSVLVETVQSATGLGVCQTSDVVRNTAGAVVAGLAALVWLLLLGRFTHRGSGTGAPGHDQATDPVRNREASGEARA